ncbi:MAG TPA: DNA-formamidopyrimidine glycosylase family protein [Candidatus Limnocylindria bacterium]|nr:DNA-formamidopyrimidine glycosylase family protein [Candidatus Limnocylindria bacterium]
MPEGDTIFRTADVLRRALRGSTVVRAVAQPRPGLARVPDLSVLVGTRVEEVESRGKHLLIGFSGGWWLRSHMRMRGSWHRYRVGEEWRLPRSRATCVLETSTAVAVCFDAPELELLTDVSLARHARLDALGPDLLARSFDLEDAVGRLSADPRRPLGEALLDQRAVAGMGNVYKSEVCFLERLDPWMPVGLVPAPTLRAALTTARRLLAANAGGGRRVTTGVGSPGRSLWVYSRAGRPCRRCGTLIQSRRQGEDGRLTYWCPRCQGGGSGDSGELA